MKKKRKINFLFNYLDKEKIKRKVERRENVIILNDIYAFITKLTYE